MTREEFEYILEEAYIEGYNTALEDIEEDILDEEAYDLEGEYEYYTESNAAARKRKKEIIERNLEIDPDQKRYVERDPRHYKPLASYRVKNAQTKRDREFYIIDHRGRDQSPDYKQTDQCRHNNLKQSIEDMKKTGKSSKLYDILTRYKTPEESTYFGKKQINDGATSKRAAEGYKKIKENILKNH